MKKFTLFFGLLLVATMINAQVQQGFKYQTVARNNAGEILASQNISFRITILHGALPGTVVYAETHSATTNATGLATLEIGRGTPVTGNFATINWSTTPIFLKTEIDPAGGSAFIEMGTSELLSVPYAFYAKTAGNGFSGNYNDLINKPALWDSTWLTIKYKPTTVNGYGITDAMTTAHPANGISNGNVANWNAAFGWGNHALAGYLTSFTETDPIFGDHPASGITFGNILNWNTAFGWGNHAAAGYLTSFTETDPIFGAWDKSTGIAINESQISDLQDYLTEELDADPANELQTITQTDYDVSLSQGGGSFMTGVKSYTQADIDAMTPYNGLTVINTTTNCVNYYVINNWFETCGTCTPQPTQANAGSDQIGLVGTSTTLDGNIPNIGTGLWVIISGEGGLLSDPTNPSSTFTGFFSENYFLTWTISNSCNSFSDTVNIRFWDCNQILTDTRDGKTYTTVQIGTQCWMAQNLNIGTRITGSIEQTSNTTIEKYCYGNIEANCDVYGGLYQWNEMMNYSTTPGMLGICPTGWHLPTDSEWCTITTYLDATVNCSTTGWSGTNAGGKMKETGSTHWTSPNTGATNSSGFKGLPGGNREPNGAFYVLGEGGTFWSSTNYSTADAWYRFLYYTKADVNRDHYTKSLGYSVRCLRD